MGKGILSRGLYIGGVSILISFFLFAPVALAQGESCMYCGMKRAKFEHSWVIVEHGENDAHGFCSVHCAAIHMALHIDKPVLKVTVGDYVSKEQIDAEKAFWVIGGDKPGVMTSRAKWAFGKKESAVEFIKNHGGRLGTDRKCVV